MYPCLIDVPYMVITSCNSWTLVLTTHAYIYIHTHTHTYTQRNHNRIVIIDRCLYYLYMCIYTALSTVVGHALLSHAYPCI